MAVALCAYIDVGSQHAHIEVGTYGCESVYEAKEWFFHLCKSFGVKPRAGISYNVEGTTAYIWVDGSQEALDQMFAEVANVADFVESPNRYALIQKKPLAPARYEKAAQSRQSQSAPRC